MELSDSEMKQLVLKLSGKIEQLEAKVTRQESQIVTLTNELTDLKERVSAQERYTSKDCIIFYNFPIDAASDDLDIDMCRAIKHHFNYELSSGDLKACHPLRRPQNTGLSVPIIIKFIYFRDKNEIYARRKMLAGFQFKGKNLFITERLPAAALEVKKACEEENLVTTTHNCEVKVFLKDPKGMVYSQKVGSTLAVKQLKDKAIKQSPRTNDKVSMQRKDNKRNLDDVENAETNNMSTHQATPIMKKLNNNNSPTLEALGGANACE